MLVNKVDNARKRLIIRPGAIGDFIVSLPALEQLQAQFTEIWTAEANLPLAGFANARKSIISAGLDRLGLMPAGDVLAKLRQFDSIVSWYGANRPDFRDLVQQEGLPFEFHAAIPPAGMGMHAVDFYSSQVGGNLGLVPRIDVGTVESHGKIVVHPFASNPGKRWPGALALEIPGETVVRLRGPEEELPGALYCADLCELGRFLAGAKAYIGNDSGITHLAAAVGTPTIALFGPTDPAVWGPRGERVRVIHAPDLAKLPAAGVLDALRDFGI